MARHAGIADARWSVFGIPAGPVLACVLGMAVEAYFLAFQHTTHVEAKGGHQVAVEEFGAQVPLTQTFTMRSDGLKGLRIRLAAREPSDVTIDWLLSEQLRPSPIVPIYGTREQLRGVSGERWVVLRFPMIVQSAGRIYRLDIRAADVRHVSTRAPIPASGEVALMASHDDAMPGGVLFVDGNARAGDLVFDTTAAGDTILGRFRLTTAARGEGRMRRVWIPAAAIAVYNILLAVFVIYFWPNTPSPAPR